MHIRRSFIGCKRLQSGQARGRFHALPYGQEYGPFLLLRQQELLRVRLTDDFYSI